MALCGAAWRNEHCFLPDCCDKSSANFDRWGNFDTFLLLHRFLKIDFSKYNLYQLSQFKLNICCAC